MNNLKTKWGIILKALAYVAPLLILKLVFHYFNFEIISLGPVITALVAGVFFVLAIILSGVLADFKESEKLPGDLVVSIEALFKDITLVAMKESTPETFGKIRKLTYSIISNFEKKGRWQASEINAAIDEIDEDIKAYSATGAPPALIVKLRNEIGNIKRISNRIEIIKETSFLPAGQTIAEFSIGVALTVMMLSIFDPFYEGLVLVGVIAIIFTSILLLVKDMDDPFAGFVKIDLKQLYKLAKYFDSKMP